VKYKGGTLICVFPSCPPVTVKMRSSLLDKETLSEKFQSLTLDVVGFSGKNPPLPALHSRTLWHGSRDGSYGSGKTTTLYAAINEIKTDEDKIVTIEDPVEYQLRGITQIPVNEKRASLSRAGCAPSCATTPTRYGGRNRDRKTAQIAIHRRSPPPRFYHRPRNNVTDVIGRFINMGVEPYTLSLL